MFGRLLKHDLKANIFEFLILFVVLVISSGLLGFAMANNYNVFSTIVILIYSGVLIAMSVISFLHMKRILFDGIYTKRGYLTFSLPISTHQLLLSRILSSIIYVVMTGIGVLLSIYVMLFFMSPTLARQILGELIHIFEHPVGLLLTFTSSLIDFIFYLMVILFVFSLSHSGIIPGKRNAITLLLFIGFYIAIGLIYLYNPIDLYLSYDSATVDIGAFIYNVVFGVGLYFATAALIEKKIELQ